MTVDTARTRSRRVTAWIAIALVLVVVGALGGAIASSLQRAERDRFDPESAGPNGTRALARILADHGVDVQIVRDRAAADTALAAGPATLVLPDSPVLSDRAVRELADAATDVVVIDPRSRSIRVLFDGRVAGYGDVEEVAPVCELAAARQAGPLVVGSVFTADAAGCYPVDDAYGLLWAERGDGRVIAVDGTTLFTNEHLADGGNAALGVGLLGSRDSLVWYVPSPADADPGDAATLGDLTPAWVTPAILLLIASGVAAILWRGRRFGPLVRERLPVTVRGDETTRGRAHLYARSRDTAHAAAALRRGATTRLGRMLGLPATTDPGTVADAVAARLGRDRGAIRGILHDDVPRTDRDLVTLTHRLHDLETDLSSALRPGKEPR